MVAAPGDARGAQQRIKFLPQFKQVRHHHIKFVVSCPAHGAHDGGGENAALFRALESVTAVFIVQWYGTTQLMLLKKAADPLAVGLVVMNQAFDSGRPRSVLQREERGDTL